MQIKAVYNKNVLRPLKKLKLKENSEVRITIKNSFYELLEEVGEIEAKEDVEKSLENMRVKKYYD